MDYGQTSGGSGQVTNGTTPANETGQTSGGSGQTSGGSQVMVQLLTAAPPMVLTHGCDRQTTTQRIKQVVDQVKQVVDQVR